ncbi:SUMF1/EgtB/PvdO family nonheme iron enzyme [Myxococcota bacterium]|nr:SUMF1/EgtB/PvdO family nonheme iron enzyme [Myxococcota bacterium]MBU1411792.1 SUMF1/EgtB/PvdO family nonheme iron enzyme [Myxococcota bacterium]MBU1512067.1 SUMF1/EgtB/PvdO family nonheme iron enzyme [Myxococcota bacterium]
MKNRTTLLTLLAVCLMLVACDTKTKSVDSCGDGFVDPGEECDGSEMTATTCTELGYYEQIGLLQCTSDCTFDLAVCTGGRCGDGTIQTIHGEDCDGDELAGATCESRGYVGGTLGCTPDCTFDTSTCDSLCGNGVVDPAEPCDGYDLRNRDCMDLGYSGGILSCQPSCLFDESECQNVCGNNLLEPSEECDDQDLRGLTCESLGYSSGALTCSSCHMVRLECEGTTTCGNGTLDVGEACDQEELDDATCTTLGFAGGVLSCGLDCRYNTSRCLGSTCGDGLINGDDDCDGADFAGATCTSLGQGTGTLACASDCTLVTIGCGGAPDCGNGVVDAFEDCDGTNLDAQTCVTLGYSDRSGALGCTGGCEFDETACVPKSTNADLATLVVSSGTLTPEFASATTLYTVTVPMAVTSLTVTATTADPYATVAITPSQPMTLAEGDNPTTVTVTAESGAQKVYTVVITQTATLDYESANIGTLIYVPGGTFQRDADPANLSTVSAFRMSRYEITRAQWVAVTGWADPSNVTYSNGTDDPVQTVSWYDAIAFCNKLSLLEGLTPVYTVSGVDFATLTYSQIPLVNDATWNTATANWAANGYRLSTEMEWMWAAMGADTAAPGVTNTTGYAKAFAGSTGTNAIGDYSWYSTNSASKTHQAGTKLPNELGLYDLSGNVFEWAWDWYTAYPTGTLTDTRGPASGTDRVFRGGGWLYDASNCPVANRYYISYDRSGSIGFRVVRP